MLERLCGVPVCSHCVKFLLHSPGFFASNIVYNFELLWSGRHIDFSGFLDHFSLFFTLKRKDMGLEFV
uniref:Uncharacterized protein n=1 Tax=Rhizophora mucronata TaxID=61149 RepID=A0A2P2PYN7_RHIMU